MRGLPLVDGHPIVVKAACRIETWLRYHDAIEQRMRACVPRIAIVDEYWVWLEAEANHNRVVWHAQRGSPLNFSTNGFSVALRMTPGWGQAKNV